MQRAFLLHVGRLRVGGLGLGRLRGRCCFGRGLRGGFLGFAFLLGLARGFALVLFLELFLLPLSERLRLRDSSSRAAISCGDRSDGGGVTAGGGVVWARRGCGVGVGAATGCGASATTSSTGGGNHLLDNRRGGCGFFLATHQHALLAHLDLDRA
jgi:hypothetical protein